VRGIFSGILGWFEGNATGLFPHPPRERARRLARLAGGAGVLLREGRRALAEGDPQWAAELADSLLLLDPGSGQARAIRAGALRALAARQGNANARSTYLTQALEAEGRLRIGAPRTAQPEVVRGIPLEAIFRAMTVSLDPERAAGLDRKLAFRFPDAGEAFTLHLRNRVAELSRGAAQDAEIEVEIAASVWKELVAGLRSPIWTFLSGEVKVRRGSLLGLIRVLRLFRPD
jgi:alkyl sulfatase BDS1-like metallo-beta-lactamase superfamily hydrolase